MSVTERVIEALRSAILLEARVTALADHVSDLAHELRDIDRRLVRVETVMEIGTKRGPVIEDRR